MRRIAILVAAVSTAGALVAGLAVSATTDSDLTKSEQHFLKQMNTSFEGGTKAGSAKNMAVVGQNAIGGRGFNADVWAHEGYAYVGQWGFEDWANGSKQRFCPEGANAGVAVIDARNPSSPVVVSRLVNPANTSVEDVVVETMRWGPYAGRDIAAVGAQTCGSRYDRTLFRGLLLYDVTNPAAPVEVGRLNTGCCTRGIHELEVNHRPDLRRTFVYATVPAGNYPDSQTASGVRDENGKGDFRLIDITNAAAPVETAEWGIQDVGGPFDAGQGCDADPNYGHGAEPSGDGKTVFLAYWDSGFVALDVTNPNAPVFKGRTIYPANADGDAHSSMYDDARRLLFTADEDFCKTSGPGIEKGLGYLRIYDYSKLSAPRQIGEFRTPNSTGTNDPGAGDYTIHNPFLVGTDVYISWYTDGIRVVDASDPRAPREVAHFVPPAGQNPVKPSQRGVLSNTTQVWGVYVDAATGLVYASDMNTGLWILRRTDR